MDAFLGKITQHAMNYAIRSGIGITASFAIGQTARLLKTVDDNGDRQELQSLQQRLDSKIRIISPAIDMVELISARGNTTLETAVTLTKALRWDIQSLGIRLEKAASAEEQSRRKSNRAKSRIAHEFEIRQIVLEIRNLLTRIEDAVPLLNLAITTSGARLSTVLPTSVSPSRLLQASTFLTAGDTQYSMNGYKTVQVGPVFTLSLYMLFAGHSYRFQEDAEGMRETTWKEVIHKSRVKLMRNPLRSSKMPQEGLSVDPTLKSVEVDGMEAPIMSAIEGASEFSYHLEIIEDLDDDRVHSFEADEPQPGPYGGVRLAGIRETLPIYQISKIFYADTGKILNIGNQGETNNPVLLLKRDVNALPPRRMMQDNREEFQHLDHEEDGPPEVDEQDTQDDIDHQIRRESSIQPLQDEHSAEEARNLPESDTWRFPPNLDPEWLALEVYTEPDDTDSEHGLENNDDLAYASHRPSSPGLESTEENLAGDFIKLDLDQESTLSNPSQEITSTKAFSNSILQNASPFGPIRSSLSLLEMLIRLTALQQFQQASHLSIPDELLTFFLEESSTTGAGGDGDQRRRTRREARQRVGFDPYDESPIKRHGEDYQYQYQSQPQREQQNYEEYSRSGTPYDEYGRSVGSPGWENERERRGATPQHRSPAPSSQRWQSGGTPEKNWLKTRESSGSRSHFSPSPSSPVASSRPGAKNSRPLDRVQQERRGVASSPLGRGQSVETDSSLGTSPGSPTLGGK